MAVAQRRMTLEQFLALPEAEPALELVDGEVTQKVSPKLLHSAIQSALVELFNRFARPRKLARAFAGLRASYGGASTVPDVSVYVWDRVPRDASGRLVDDVFEPPDIAVEIVSPEQRVNDLLIRCLWYVAQGVRVAALVDPRTTLVVAFRAGAEPIVFDSDGTLGLEDVIPNFGIDVAALFDELNAD